MRNLMYVKHKHIQGAYKTMARGKSYSESSKARVVLTAILVKVKTRVEFVLIGS
jgi:hypothetical protein